MAVIRFLLAVALLSVGCGAAEAVIDGPSESEAGNLIVLNSVRSKGDASTWIVPPNLGDRYVKVGHQLAFAVREPGEFVFHLVVVETTPTDKDEPVIEIATATHTVKIADGFCEPPQDPDKPTDPDRPEPPSPKPELQKLSRDAAVKLADPATAGPLSDAIEKAIEGSTTLESCKIAVQSAVESTLLARVGSSRDKDWLGTWRIPVSNAIGNPQSLAEYRQSLAAVAAGLRESLGIQPPRNDPAPSPTKRIVMLTRDNCGWCNRWKQEIQPLVEKMGFAVEYRQSSGNVPAFTVYVGGSIYELKGYQPTESFERFAKDLAAIVK